MKYEIRCSGTTAKDIEAYSELLLSCFKGTEKFTPEFLYWQYVQNPHGLIVGSNAYFEGKLVAHHATIPVLYTIFGDNYKGLLAINNVTHPDHRGKGLLTNLGKATFEEAIKLKYQFVITVTNQNSTHGYLSKFGFRLIAPLTVKLGIGSIVNSDISNSKVFAAWSDESLRWRVQNPSGRYFRKNNRIIAKTGIPGIYAQLKDSNDLRLDSIGIKTKRSNIIVWMGLSNRIKIRGYFISMPEILKPSPLNLLFKDLQGNLPKFGKEDINFELADFDAF
jgi:GNAT superfamily N-acetyltransferase